MASLVVVVVVFALPRAVALVVSLGVPWLHLPTVGGDAPPPFWSAPVGAAQHACPRLAQPVQTAGFSNIFKLFC